MNILITGGTSGIGHDLARVLNYLGHNVYACCHTEEERKRLEKNGEGDIHYLKLDITKEEDYPILSDFNIDVLVNQAGIGIGGSLLDLNLSDIEKNFQVNVFSTLALSKYFIADCKEKNRSGKILITSSLAGDLPIPFLGSYTATKASLTILSKTLKEEIDLAHLDIRVKLIKPGAYQTGFNEYMLTHIENSSYFENSEEIYCMLKKIFTMIEQKSNRTIVNKMVQAILSNSNRLVYSAPLSQSIFTKIYCIFQK